MFRVISSTSRWSKDCWKRTNSASSARALYCLHLWQWEPLGIVEKRTKTSFVARLTPAQRSPLVTLHRARRLTGAFHKFFRICKKPSQVASNRSFPQKSYVFMSKTKKLVLLPLGHLKPHTIINMWCWASWRASRFIFESRLYCTAMNYVKLKVLEAG